MSSTNYLYNVARKWFVVASVTLFPVTFVINAPFGRFSPSRDSWLLVDGVKSWIVMELVSPLMFLYAYMTSPISYYTPTLPAWSSPQSILAFLYLVHYANRAVIGPLRTPSRSKSHIIVPLSAVAFNIINGLLMGSYLSSPFARMFLTPTYTYRRTSFYIGLALWFAGFVGNIAHDEILLNIRRKAKSKGKGKAEERNDDHNRTDKTKSGKRVEEYYSIPQGLLYKYISYPNYFCEWIEWFGFALAAAPLPFEPSSFFRVTLDVFSTQTIKSVFSEPAHVFLPNLAPPYIFFLTEVLLMLPRAYNGHKWYKTRFGDAYPKERKIVIPFLL
ncbi:hypothetical protein AX17_006695 [Amanita inopinata Kibby_2008]|nr:hypothetical protein AX17_006695 [Amanita inopinata Kibby_2008]